MLPADSRQLRQRWLAILLFAMLLMLAISLPALLATPCIR